MFKSKYPISLKKRLELSIYLAPFKVTPWTYNFVLPWYPGYDIYDDGCTMIIHKYYQNPLTGGKKLYENKTFILQNPDCKPPSEPPTQLPLSGQKPILNCEGDHLRIWYPIAIRVHKEDSVWLRYDHLDATVYADLVNVKFPIGELRTALFTIQWRVVTKWATQMTGKRDPLYGYEHEKIDVPTRMHTIQYEVRRDEDGFYVIGDLTYGRRDNHTNTNRHYRVPTHYHGSFGIFETIQMFIGTNASGDYQAFTRDREAYTIQDQSQNTLTYLVEQYWDGKCFSQPTQFGEPPPVLNSDTCCPQNDKLLKAILKVVKENKKRIGEFPAEVPDSLVAEQPTPIEIKSIADFISYAIIQMDALVGQFPIEMEIADFDLTKQGDQPKEIKLPNIAETLAEIMGLLCVLKMESQVNVETGIKGLIEAGQTKQAATISADVALANSEYLGYNLKKISKEIALSFTPGKEKLDEFLKEKKIDYATYENGESNDLKDSLAPLLQMAAMYRAQNYVNLASDAAQTASQLRGILESPDKIAEEIKKQSDEQNFKQWRDEIEEGFSKDPKMPQSGIDKPYGKDRTERPRIRKLGEQ